MTVKTSYELEVAEAFAAALTQERGRVYFVKAPERQDDVADAFLCAGDESIPLQLRFVSSEEGMRWDKALRGLRETLSKTLQGKGYRNCFITLRPSRMPEKREIAIWHDALVELITSHTSGRERPITLRDQPPFPFGNLPFSELEIASGGVADPDSVGVAILRIMDALELKVAVEQAISKKSTHYDRPDKVWLLLHPGSGAEGFHSTNFHGQHFAGVERFASVWWINHPFRPTDIGRLGV